jgi:hypothetical protein
MEVVQPLETPPQPGAKRNQQLNELGELRDKVDENTKLYKGRTKTDYDKNHNKKEFHVGQKVWTYKPRLRLPLVNSSIDGLVLVLSLMCFLRELWRFIVHRKIKHVNGHRVKPYIGVNSTPRAPEPHLVDFKCIFPKE